MEKLNLKQQNKTIIGERIDTKSVLTIYYWSYISNTSLQLQHTDFKEIEILKYVIKLFYPQINIIENDCKDNINYKFCHNRLTFLICTNYYCEDFNEIESIMQHINIYYGK